MVEGKYENILEGVTGFLVVLDLIGWIIIDFTGFLSSWGSLAIVTEITLVAGMMMVFMLLIYKLMAGKICVPSLIILFPMLFTGVIKIFSIAFPPELLLVFNVLASTFGIMLIVEAFDAFPQEDKLEIAVR